MRKSAIILIFLSGPLLVLGVFLCLPILTILRTGFYEGSDPYGSGWTLAQYARFLQDSYYWEILLQTLGLGVLVATLTMIAGFPVGYSLARLSSARRRWRLLLVISPLTLSLVVVVFGWLVVLGRNGLLNVILTWIGLIESPQRFLFNRTAVVVVLMQQFLPFMILSVMSVVMQIEPQLEQASASLRADRFTTFRRIVMPLAAPGIAAGFSLVFIMTVSAFITPRLIGGAKIQMMGSLIFEQVLTILNWPFAAAMAFVLLLAIAAATVLIAMFFARTTGRTAR